MNDKKIYVSHYNFDEEVKKQQNIKNIKICDTTLRDGEQTAGVVFNEEEKLEITKLLVEFGVEQIEAGIPIISKTDKETIKKIVNKVKNEGLDVSIMGWSRAKKEDIDAVIETGCDAIAISLATSEIHLQYKLRKTKEEILNIITNAVEYAKSHGLYVSFNAEDGTRTNFDFLIKYIKACKEAKGDRLRLCDTVSALCPSSTKFLVRKIKETIDIPIEIHSHNDYGLAVANSLAAIEAGAEYVSTTINGIGERAGNCSLEQLVMCLKAFYNIDLKYKTEILKKMSEYVEKASNIKISSNSPIVGENAFRHESGIHVDGLIKFPYTYETFPPEMVGQKRKFVIGKQSGRAAIKMKLDEYNIKCPDDKIDEILKHVKLFSENRKSALTDEEFLKIAKSIIEGGESFVAVNVLPKKRDEVYREISKFLGVDAYVVSGDIDLILKVPNKNLEEIRNKINNIDGVTQTITYGVVKKL